MTWHVEWDNDSPADRYQQEIERTERERRAAGWDVPGGWARPTDPPCKRPGHQRMGTVLGLCGFCVMEIKQEPLGNPYADREEAA